SSRNTWTRGTPRVTSRSPTPMLRESPAPGGLRRRVRCAALCLAALAIVVVLLESGAPTPANEHHELPRATPAAESRPLARLAPTRKPETLQVGTAANAAPVILHAA